MPAAVTWRATLRRSSFQLPGGEKVLDKSAHGKIFIRTIDVRVGYLIFLLIRARRNQRDSRGGKSRRIYFLRP